MIIPKNKNILNYLQKMNINIVSPCNGKGICGKCKVSIASKPKANKQELEMLSLEEIHNGIRLACTRKTLEDTEITLLNEYSNMKITSSFNTVNKKNPYIKLVASDKEYKVYRGTELIALTNENKAYGIAIDIGTTTVVVTLNDLVSNQTIDITSFLNPQSKYGSDVISRIQFGGDKHNLLILANLIKNAIDNSIENLLIQNGILDKDIYEVIIAANNTMVHLLLETDPTPLALAPYKSDLLETITCPYSEVFSKDRKATLTIFGGFDAFVGGDIVSGIYSENLHQKKQFNLLVDLGTNGEIALINNQQILATSTAAGPAFEGVNIFCGIGAVAGAISKYKYPNEIETINQETAIGICGSGLIDIVSELVENDIVSFSGRMKETFTITDNIVLVPKDIREVQLAKAAIRAGIEHLMINGSVTTSDIETVYIAGGFGKHINLDNFFKLGIIPNELRTKVKVIGNSSLAGAVKYLYRPLSTQIDDIRSNCEIVQLGTSKTFQELYVANMHFN